MSKDFVAEQGERQKEILRQLGTKLLGYLGLAVLIVIVLMTVAVVYRSCCDEPPVRIASLDIDKEHPPVCPGELYPVRSTITIERPTLLYIYISVMNMGTDFSMADTQVSFPPRPHPHATEFVQTLEWIVPPLEPGEYARVVTVRGHDSEQDPSFSIVPFRVPSNCKSVPTRRNTLR